MAKKVDAKKCEKNLKGYQAKVVATPQQGRRNREKPVQIAPINKTWKND